MYSLESAWGTSPTNLWAVGTDGTIAHWDGTAVTTRNRGTAALHDIWGVAGGAAWIVGDRMRRATIRQHLHAGRAQAATRAPQILRDVARECALAPKSQRHVQPHARDVLAVCA